MGTERSDKLDEVANGLDELKTTVEELEEDPPSGVNRVQLKVLERTLEEARDISDDLEDDSNE